MLAMPQRDLTPEAAAARLRELMVPGEKNRGNSAVQHPV
jgi:galactose-1-phosphate uridylyltransferase